MKSNSVLTFLSVALLSACGGGGSSANNQQTIITDPIKSTSPAVTLIKPNKATVGELTIFEIVGSDLTTGMSFSLEKCDSPIELSGGSGTLRRFSCTPLDGYGQHKGRLSINSTSTIIFSVDYQSPIMSMDNALFGYGIVTPDSSLYVWGSAAFSEKGQIGPQKIGEGYKSITIGEAAAFAIKKDGTLWAWGSNFEGILGVPSLGVSNTPTYVGANFKKIVTKGTNTTAGESIVALKEDGSVWVWGARSSTVPLSIERQSIPKMVFANGYIDIARGTNGEMYGIKEDGSLWTWNRNPSDTPFVPTKVGQGYSTVTSGFDVAYGLKSDGSLWSWGRFAPFQTSTAITTPDNPTLIGKDFKSVSTGTRQTTVGVKTDNSLWGIGDPDHGGVDNNKLNDFISAVAGNNCTLAQKSDGTVWAWGLCDFADGKYRRYQTTPEQILGLKK